MTPANGAFSYDATRRRAKVRVYAGLDPVTGRQRVRSKTWQSPNVTSARRESHKVIARLQEEARQAIEAAGTVAGYVAEWESTMVAERKSPATLYRNRSIVKAIVDGLGDYKLDELDVRAVERWYTKLRAENVGQGSIERYRSESTIHHYHRILHQILTAAERQGLLRVAPTRRAKPPKRPRPRPRPPETAVLVELLSSAPPALQVAASLAAHLGLRRGELMGLRWSDIRNGVVHVERSVVDVPKRPVSFKPPKTAESVRSVHLAPGPARLLINWHEKLEREGFTLAEDAVIIPDNADLTGRTPRRPDWLSAAWTAHCKRHGVHVRFHDLRHWAATNMVAAGVAITDVAKQLGHARTSTTLDVYSRAIGVNDAAVEVLGPLLELRESSP